MRCDEAQELITGLVDGELTATERIATEQHLAACHDCRAQFERETTVKRDMKLAASAIVVPQALREKIELLRGEVRAPRRETKGASVLKWLAGLHLRPVYGLAFVALIVAVMLLPWRPNQD